MASAPSGRQPAASRRFQSSTSSPATSATAFRRISLAPAGRSAVLLIGSLDADGALTLTVTASTVRPIRLLFPKAPDASTLRAAISEQIADDLYHADIHGKPLWRKHMTLRLAEEIRGELLDMAGS